MDKFNVIVVWNIVAAAAFLGGAMLTPALAQENMSMTMITPQYQWIKWVISP
jgi:K+ transporter